MRDGIRAACDDGSSSSDTEGVTGGTADNCDEGDEGDGFGSAYAAVQRAARQKA